MSDIVIRKLAPGERRAAGALLGRAMRDNPLHIRVVGPDPARREAAFGGIFGTLLASVHAARGGAEVTGPEGMARRR